MRKKGPAGNVNFIIYVRDRLTESELSQIKNTKLVDIVRQIGVEVGTVESVNDKTVVVYESDNFVAAKLKIAIGKWCTVETFAEVHPKLNNLGDLAKGSN